MRNETLTYSEEDKDKIKELLLGRKVTKVSEDELELDNGYLLRLEGNEGGCACDAGVYNLIALNDTDNIITDVRFEDAPGGDYHDGDYTGYYRIFVFADNKEINLATFEGSDGNGYYGTGYAIHVTPKVED